MDISRFHSQHDRFPLLDLMAQFDFKTETSIAFLVGEGTSCFFHVHGRVELHHPCMREFEGQAKVYVRVTLPARYVTEEKLEETIQQSLKTLYTVLSIPDEDTYEARFSEVGPKAYVVFDGEVRAYSSM